MKVQYSAHRWLQGSVASRQNTYSYISILTVLPKKNLQQIRHKLTKVLNNIRS